MTAKTSVCTGIGRSSGKSKARQLKSEINGVANDAESGIISEKSNKPVTAITDKSIDSVPKVEIDGLTDEQNTFIQQQHKELLAYSREYNANNEVAFVFDKNMQSRIDKPILGSDDRLDLGNLSGSDLLVLHNHPRNSSFSTTDLTTFLSSNDIKTMTIVKNNGAVEALTKTSTFDATSMTNSFKRILRNTVKQQTSSEYSKAVQKFIDKHNTDGGMIEWIKK